MLMEVRISKLGGLWIAWRNNERRGLIRKLGEGRCQGYGYSQVNLSRNVWV